MNILHISTAYPIANGNIYSDLDEVLSRNGHTIDVLLSDTSLILSDSPHFLKQNGVSILRVPTFKLHKMGIVKKAVAFITLPLFLKKALKKYLSHSKYDIIIFDAPPLTLTPVVALAKKLFKCPVFLMQKDIFPENAVDLGLFSKLSPIYWYFRRQEKKMLALSDKIGCMSERNIRYIRSHNPQIAPEKVVYFPNALKIKSDSKKNDRKSVLEKFGISANTCVFLYGGNMGIPQHMQLLASAIKHFKNDERMFFLCVGTGTNAHIVKNAIEKAKPKNARYYSEIHRNEYNALVENCDVGIVSLSPRFTIPNYPSKVLSYLESSLPVLAATDTNTDFRELIESQAKCGLWCNSSIEDDFFKAIEKLATDKNLREMFGHNGRIFLENNFDVEYWAKKLCHFFE